MREAGAGKHLREEEQRGDDHELERGALRFGRLEDRRVWRARRRAMPSEMSEPAKGQQHDGGARQQEHQAEHAVDHGPAGQHVAGQRIVGKVVRVGMRQTGPRRRRGPGGPGKERGQLAQFLRIGDRPRRQPAIVGGRHEVVPPIGDLALERGRVCRTEAQGPGRGVVAVLLHRPGDAAVDLGLLLGRELDIGTAEPLLRGLVGDVERPVVQVLRREVRAEIGAMAPYRAVVHEAVLEEDLLARGHVLAGEEDRAGSVDDPGGNGRCLAVGLDGHRDQNRKAEHHRDDGRNLPPDPRGAAAERDVFAGHDALTSPAVCWTLSHRYLERTSARLRGVRRFDCLGDGTYQRARFLAESRRNVRYRTEQVR